MRSGEPALHVDGAAYRLHHAAEFDHRPVAGALDEPPVVDCDRGVDEIAAQRPQPGQRPLFVRSGQPAVADNVSDKDCRDFPPLGQATLHAIFVRPRRPVALALRFGLPRRLHKGSLDAGALMSINAQNLRRPIVPQSKKRDKTWRL